MPDLQRLASSMDFPLPIEALQLDAPQHYILQNHRCEAVPIEPTVPLDRLSDILTRAMSGHDANDAAMDSVVAVPLHKALRISRRQAADRRLWAWLGAMQFADFVAHRWGPNPSTGLRSLERFTGDRVRQTFARLWWAAELTKGEGGSYALTERLLGLGGFQDTYEAIFGRAFCGYPPALKAFIEVVGPKPERVIRRTAKEFSYVLTTVTLEAMGEGDLRDLLGEIIEGCEA